MSKKHVDVSVSVVLYRDYETPLMMIESLEGNTAASLSKMIFVVDNSDLNDDEKLLSARAVFIEKIKTYSDIVYIDVRDNLGFGKANNLALQRADSDYHVFINPDVVFIEDTLSILFKYMQRNPDIGMTIPRLIDENGNLQSAYRREVTVLDGLNRTLLRGIMKKRTVKHSMMDMDYTKPFAVPFGQGSFLYGRTPLLKEIGGFDDRFFMYLEDADLCRRVNQKSKLMYVPYSTVIHKWEKGSHRNIHLMATHIRSYYAYFCKWGFKFA